MQSAVQLVVQLVMQLVMQQYSQCAVSGAAVQSVVQQWMWQCSAAVQSVVQQWVWHRASCIGDIKFLVGASSGACDKTISAAMRLMSAGQRQD